MAKVNADYRVEERTRLAVELHDSLSQNLTGITLEVDAAVRNIDPGADKALRHLDLAAKTLTDRQRAILESLVRGLSNDDIARQFGIAEITVRNHLVAIFEKIGAGSRTEAVAITLRKQLLKI